MKSQEKFQKLPNRLKSIVIFSSENEIARKSGVSSHFHFGYHLVPDSGDPQTIACNVSLYAGSSTNYVGFCDLDSGFIRSDICIQKSQTQINRSQISGGRTIPYHWDCCNFSIYSTIGQRNPKPPVSISGTSQTSRLEMQKECIRVVLPGVTTTK